MWGKLLFGALATSMAYGAVKNAYQQHQANTQAQIDQAIEHILAVSATPCWPGTVPPAVARPHHRPAERSRRAGAGRAATGAALRHGL